MFMAYLLRNSWTKLAKLFFYYLHLGQGVVFGQKKCWIRDPVFPEIWRNLDIVEGVEIELWYIPQFYRKPKIKGCCRHAFSP